MRCRISIIFYGDDVWKKGLKDDPDIIIVKEASTLTRSEFGRVVKATVLRSVGEIRVSSILTARTRTIFEAW